MKTVGYYLDYAAQSFGVADRNSLEAQHLALFKKYFHNVLEDWESKGDMDYLKQLGFYKTIAPTSNNVTANKGQDEITLDTAITFDALGCDIQINSKMYTLTKMIDDVTWKIFPAFMDDNVVSYPCGIRYNRFPVPPYFKKFLNRQMIYLQDLTSPYYIEERDFVLFGKTNTSGVPNFCQVKFTARNAGFEGECTVTGDALTSEDTDLTPEMVGLPIQFEGVEETYFLRSISDSDEAVLDRPLSADITVATAFRIVPQGWKFIEIYPHPNDAKQIIFDYLETEVDKISDTEPILAPSVVVEAGLDIHLGRFSEESAATKNLFISNFEQKKEDQKSKVITDYTPSVNYLGSNQRSQANGDYSDYGFNRFNRRNFRGRRQR